MAGGSGTRGKAGEKRKRRRWAAVRAAIEPVIGHLKSDNCLGGNFYKVMEGGMFDELPTAAAFNFKKSPAKSLSLFFVFRQRRRFLSLYTGFWGILVTIRL